jgi:hypothetical protein
MPRFLIEVPHEADFAACTKAVEVFLRTGSHFLTHADWGCTDGEHKAWIIADVDSKDEARNIVPADFRLKARVVGLNTFTMTQIEEMRRSHDAGAGR